ncbi:MAG: shikimate kinase [Pseudomonadota bacterium]
MLDSHLLIMRKAIWMAQAESKPSSAARAANIVAKLGGRPIVLVGLMGAGKSAIGRKLAQALGLPFLDGDTEIEKAADMPVADIFEAYGEPEFRRLETNVMRRLLGEGELVLATGGGAFMGETTRGAIKAASVSVWLSADLDLLMARVMRKSTRPLLQKPNPRAIMQELMDKRYPVYAQADITVQSQDVSKEAMADIVMTALENHLDTPHP